MELNENKIAFIFCYNNEEQLKNTKLNIESLHIPNGYEIEVVPVKEPLVICTGYNVGMSRTDAKYKVYLHQETLIINKNFIKDILRIFQANKTIGLIGVIGAKVIPTNGIWLDAHEKFGKVSEIDKSQIVSFNETTNPFEFVQAVDGLIMITQYDLPWRDDVFRGLHFFDISQCVEFLKNEYQIVVPKQEDPWCELKFGMNNHLNDGYEEYRNVFLDQYSEYLFPIVSILIPTYNRPEYLKEALESVLEQSYRNIEIIICDDSTNDQTERMMQLFLKKNSAIKYFKNPKKLGGSTGLENAHKCFSLSKGEFINFLMDDDKFSPEKITKMVNYFIQFNNITLVTSFRQIINEKGDFLNSIPATIKMFEVDTVLEGKEIVKYVLSNLLNVIGEPTTVLFRKNDIIGDFGYYLERQYKPLSDVSTWFHLLVNGRAVYIAEPLSFFRIHVGQNANFMENWLIGAIEWFHLIKDSYEHGLIEDDLSDFKKYLSVWLRKHNFIIDNIFDPEFEMENRKLRDQLNNCYKECLYILG